MAPVSGMGGRVSGGHYVVQRGDTLYSIAWRHGLDYRAVARWNRIDPPYVIYPGQRLRLSQAGARVAKAPATRQASAPKPAPARRPAAHSPAPSRPAAAATTIAWRWPAAGSVTRRFDASAQGKQGIELVGRLGEPVSAAAGGRVVYAGSGLRGYGNLIIVKHDSRYLTAYGYNRELLVKEGEQVKPGQRIATMGMSANGRPALHFELRRDGKPVDPLKYLPRR